jgi:integrase
MSKRGFGSVYLRGRTYWIRYWHHGHEYRESSSSDSESKARQLLKKRLGEIGKGRLSGQSEEKVSFEDLTEMLRSDYIVNGRRSLKKIDYCLAHLSAYFGLDRAIDISADRVRAYIVERQREGAANGTVNRELAALKRAFNLAVEAERISRRPHIAMLEENSARQGFLDHGGFLALRDALPEHLRDPVSFLYLSGWRVSEMKGLQWRDVDAGKAVRLRPELSKNKDGRVLPLAGELMEIMERAQRHRRLECPFVFHHKGSSLKDFRESWRRACLKAGLQKLLVHDLRRSAVRNMVRAGVPERIAMAMSGHQTRSIFDRYNIVNEADLVQATERLQAHLAAQPVAAKVVPLKVAEL